MSTALVGFRRDLRLHDNPVLSQAVAAHAKVIISMRHRSQSERFDPDGTYVRRWLPELAVVPTPCLHQPWIPVPTL